MQRDQGTNPATPEKPETPHDSLANEKLGFWGKLKKIKGNILKGKVKKEAETDLKEEKNIRDVIQGIFGATIISSLLLKITRFFTGSFNEDEVRKKFDKEAEEIAKKKIDISDYVVSHRALGYGRNKQNSKEALETTLQNGEQQVEIDIREFDGVLYLSHDPIKDAEDAKTKLKFDDALIIFAKNGKQDKKGDWPALYLDVKGKGLIPKIDAAIEKADSAGHGQPIKKRHFILSFDSEILREASKTPGRPLIFYYIPTGKITGLATMMSIVGWSGAKKLLNSIDQSAGTTFSTSLKNVELKVNGKSVGNDPDGGDRAFNLFNELPSDEILNRIKASNGYICVPPQLCTKKLVEKAHAKGVKVAVWGANNSTIKEMLFKLKVDKVITDTPDFVKQQGK